MGYHFFSSRTWRAPLLLIDSWLPTPAPHRSARHHQTTPVTRFFRAGWLGRSKTVSPYQPTLNVGSLSETAVKSTQPASGSTSGAATVVRESSRLLISGRLVDVCAELDRLAASELSGQGA